MAGGPTATRSDHARRIVADPGLLADAQRDAAVARTAQAERDVLEGPAIAALLVVDDQIAVLQTDLVEVLAVEPGQAQAVEPVEAGEQAGKRFLAVGRRAGAAASSIPEAVTTAAGV